MDPILMECLIIS